MSRNRRTYFRRGFSDVPNAVVHTNGRTEIELVRTLDYGKYPEDGGPRVSVVLCLDDYDLIALAGMAASAVYERKKRAARLVKDLKQAVEGPEG